MCRFWRSLARYADGGDRYGVALAAVEIYTSLHIVAVEKVASLAVGEISLLSPSRRAGSSSCRRLRHVDILSVETCVVLLTAV